MSVYWLVGCESVALSTDMENGITQITFPKNDIYTLYKRIACCWGICLNKTIGWPYMANNRNDYTCCMAINLLHKSHNASVPYPTMLHSEQKFLFWMEHWDMEQEHSVICEIGLFQSTTQIFKWAVRTSI